MTHCCYLNAADAAHVRLLAPGYFEKVKADNPLSIPHMTASHCPCSAIQMAEKAGAIEADIGIYQKIAASKSGLNCLKLAIKIKGLSSDDR